MLINREISQNLLRSSKLAFHYIFLFTIATTFSACSGGGGSGGGNRDTTAPTVTVDIPVAGQLNVDIATSVIVTFSELMEPSTINTSTFTLSDNMMSVPGIVSYSGTLATFTPSSPLVANTTYTATITTGAKDLAGNSISTKKSWHFSTGSTFTVQLSWNINPESAVNKAGGGYKVYYSTISGFEPGDMGTTEIDVPYVSGANAPNTVDIELSPGTYYFRLAAYSALNSPWSSGGSMSNASPEVVQIVP